MAKNSLVSSSRVAASDGGRSYILTSHSVQPSSKFKAVARA